LDGFDEKNLAIDYSDVDYCLKALEKGYRIVVNSHALLIHDESATRGDNQGQGAILNQAEADFLVAKWKNLIRHDPHYHPRFSLDLKDNAYTVINA
jgi:GT2 family glycosyltransferase